ncbi:Rv2578c family radical SAM protein [Pseudonocardia sp. MH-G8]|uniref:Rv2578c family radical SAM protein n=1 Tax=Pseudonocardia sp. MH-G8 TaxID=1854588 RepID=UPI0018EA10E2|nr:Rv2578c family radical SAM protein [Pseudonocardia sp. MH-G8]
MGSGFRWGGQQVLDDGVGDAPALPGLRGVLRSVRTPEFADTVFHEVEAKSVLNRVPGESAMPFRWTVNPYRGCSHACSYCFARNTHTYLGLDAGADFDGQIVVKVNVARVLERELRSPRWAREPVAMGTNTDPYQRAEGRYRLMPGVISALAGSGTPFSVLSKGTVLARDLPQLASAAGEVPVSLGVSIALLDRALQARLEPGTPSPAARLDLVKRITDAGLYCGVMVAPVLPLLTDSAEALDALFGRIAAAGASGATVLALHLRPGAREWFHAWLAREHPHLVEPYARLYRRGAYVDPEYRRALAERVRPLLRRHGLERGVGMLRTPAASRPDPPAPAAEQLTLL